MGRYIYENDTAIDTETGEILPLIDTKVIVGSKIISPALQESRRNFAVKRQRKQNKKLANEDLGDFYMILHENKIIELSPETAGRLIYLCTYLNYSNEFMLNKNTRMMKKDLQKILDVSRQTVDNFWRDIKDVYVSESESGLILVCDDIIRGRMDKGNTYFQKLYITTIRNIYQATSKRNRKYLGYIYKLLPYINLEYNLVCKNPFEMDLDKIDTMSVGEICDVIGFEKSNFHRMVKILDKIELDINGRKELFVSYVKNTRGTRFFVNPHILYAGSYYRKVEILGAFCR